MKPIPKTSGFTLLEILVVVALIGIFTSIVIVSLTAARNKGADASIATSLTNVRSQAELIGNGSGGTVSYLTLCSNEMVVKIGASIDEKNGEGEQYCRVTQSTWVYASQLIGAHDEYLCVDTTGATVRNTGVLESPSGTSCATLVP